MKAFFIDLDGTLLDKNSMLSEKNNLALQLLGKHKCLRIAATGRSLFSCNKVFNNNTPIDYLLFSSGAGIMHWRTKEIIKKSGLNIEESNPIVQILKQFDVNFMVHLPIPENHKFWFYKSKKSFHEDFHKRLAHYLPYAKPLTKNVVLPEQVSQFIAILPPDLHLFQRIEQQLKNVAVIRTTSPLDHLSLWLEVFPKSVSKGCSAEWLCNYLNISNIDTASIGNDYNDFDLLEWTNRSYVVENAPFDMKQLFTVVPHHTKNGFFEAACNFFPEAFI